MRKDDNPHLIKRLAIDGLGIVCIVGAILFGWIPGPGGIPLLFAGLGLLSINHEWARKLLHELKTKGKSLSDVIFVENRLIVWVYDIIATAIIIFVSVSFSKASGSIIQGMLVALAFVGISLFLGNKKRLQRLSQFVKKQSRKT